MKSGERFALFAFFCICLLTRQASAHNTLAEAYAAIGFDPNFPGNKVIVYASDQHMCLDSNATPTPTLTTNFQWQLVDTINSMSPPPAKIIFAGDASMVFSEVPGTDGLDYPTVVRMATNEMNYFKIGVHAFTNIDQTNIVWFPGNHDQSPRETNAETFHTVFPFMPSCQAFDLGGVRFFLFNSGNYDEPSPGDRAWLAQQVAATSPTQEVAFVTHQQPFPGGCSQRGVAVILKNLFSSWQHRWWVLCGHGHAYGNSTWDIGASNVVQLAVGPASTNTFVGFSQDVGCMFLCLSNGMAGQIYYRMKYPKFDVVYETDWSHPSHYIAPLSEVPGLLWQRMKTHVVFPELIVTNIWTDSYDWWAYPVEIQWALPLKEHAYSATDFLVLCDDFAANVEASFSADRTNWISVPVPPYSPDYVHRFPIPASLRNLDTAYFRFLGDGNANNFIGAWGLSTSNPPPYVRYPKLIPTTNVQATPSGILVFTNQVLDPYAPPDVLNFTLLSGPSGATLDPHTGVFRWQLPPTNWPTNITVTISVMDSAPAPFGDTQTFSIMIVPSPPIQFATPVWSSPYIDLTLHGGSGLVYTIQTSTNLQTWTTLLITNAPLLPLNLRYPVSKAIPRTFYRAIALELAENQPPPDMDAYDFMGRAGITNATHTNAILQLVADAKAHGWWTNCDAIYPFIGGTPFAHSCNLKSSQFSISWHGSLIHDSNGVTGDGTAAYGDTGLNFKRNGVIFTTNSAHLFLYSGTASPGGVFIGGYRWYGTLSRSFLQPDHASLDLSGLNNNDGAASGVSVGSDFRGPLVATRTGSTNQFVAARDLWAPGTTTPAIEPPDAPCALLCRLDQDGVAANFSNVNLRGATFGGGMSQAQWDTFRADWDRFEAALGRKAP